MARSISMARSLSPRRRATASWSSSLGGLGIESEEFVPEGDSGHQLFWAQRPYDVAGDR
jgi:hypothetical protein